MLGAGVAGCGEEKKPAPPPPPPAVEIKIGHVAPLTGGIAHLGKDNEQGALLAIEEANAAGIKIAIVSNQGGIMTTHSTLILGQ